MSGLCGAVWIDGTLVDSEPIALVQWEIVLARHGLQGDGRRLVVDRGPADFDAFYDYFSERIELPPQDAFMEEYVERLFPILRSELRAFDRCGRCGSPPRLAPGADGGGLLGHRERLELMLDVTGLGGLLSRHGER